MKWAVIGLGGSGTGHARRIAQMPELELVGGYDPRADARDAFTRAFDVPAWESLDSLLASPELDGVTVAASSLLHAALAVQALQAGKHALVEKPFAPDAALAGRVLEAAREAGRVVAPFHNRRFDPDFAMVCEVLGSGRLGRVRRIHSFVGGPSPSTGWRTVRAEAGGRLYDWGPHLLDQVLSLTDAPVAEVRGILHTLEERGDADEYFRAELRFADGLDATVEMCGFSFLPPMRWHVLGEKGTLQVTGNIHGEFSVAVACEGGEPEVIATSAAAERERRGDGALLIYRSLVRHIAAGEPLAVTADDALRVARVLDAILKSGSSD